MWHSPSKDLLICTSDAYCLRVARLMSLTVFLLEFFVWRLHVSSSTP